MQTILEVKNEIICFTAFLKLIIRGNCRQYKVTNIPAMATQYKEDCMAPNFLKFYIAVINPLSSIITAITQQHIMNDFTIFESFSSEK
ncbi:hypothetical protein PN36_09350 [Candidatus Thiomargarita nelsonii]|uniref:Uncharacterized protein n=1 Tax=Candidatus Thiomargarita nelsonii TaxID=1003181 RepID=A0A0A6P6V5_9GAMM|nr:hypothetical protein PN36_09350 [Candidatus Thiomargarita nelsonii]